MAQMKVYISISSKVKNKQFSQGFTEQREPYM